MTDNAPPSSNSSYTLPPLGQNPSTDEQGTTPGSFAKPPVIAPGARGRWTFASPDTPGMPQPSEKTAWDFLPEQWESQVLEERPVDLELVDREAFQVGEGGIAGAEVIDRKAHTEGLDGRE